MLLGHDDRYVQDSGMQVTIAFNHFGEALVQRMPRCRHGYIHVVNNDFTAWQMYAIGGSAQPTINSQGNRYTAPVDPNAKEVLLSLFLRLKFCFLITQMIQLIHLPRHLLNIRFKNICFSFP